MALGTKLNGTFRTFIEAQPMFFVATAARDGRVNVSPKGMDTLRILDDQRIVWLSLSGSGNETAAHLLDTPRMTLMFCSFSERALILRVYGSARAIHPRDAEWQELLGMFPSLAGSRQIYDLAIDSVQTSCGTGVPTMAMGQQRGLEDLEPYYAEMGEDGLRTYWQRKNTESIDGFATQIFAE